MAALEIRNARLIDGTGAPPRDNVQIRIADGKIADIRDESAATDAAEGTRTIDARGCSVMPGLIDAHCHISYGEGRGAEEVDVYGGAEWAAVRAVFNARKVLLAGVTSFCDPGSTWNVAVTVRDAIINGMFPGPRVFAAGRHISADGAFADYFPSWLGMPVSAEGVLCSTKDEIITEVRRQVKNRVDLIKISGDSQAQERSEDSGPAFTDDEMEALVRMARHLGRKTTIHARYPKTVVAAVRAGVSWIIHASYMRTQDIGLVRDSGIPLCPTLAFTANIVEHGLDVGVDPKYVEIKRRELDALTTIYQRAHEAGIPLMAGSEAGFSVTPYGYWHARELELLVKYIGLSPMEAIVAGTSANARAFGWEDDVGIIRTGARADLLVVDADPLADISVLGEQDRLLTIIKDGEEVDRSNPPVSPRMRMSHERGFFVSSQMLFR